MNHAITIFCMLFVVTACSQQLSVPQSPITAKDCLSTQEVTYEPGWEGQKTRKITPCEILARSTTNIDELAILMNTQDIPTLSSITQNSNAPENLLTQIYLRKDIPPEWINIIHYHLSANNHTSSEILQELGKFDINDKYERLDILQNVAMNPNTPQKTLHQLSEHKNYNVIGVLARNSKISPDIIESLMDFDEDAFDAQVTVHSGIAKNPSTPKHVLLRLLYEKGDTTAISNFGANILRIEQEVLNARDYFNEHYPNDPSFVASDGRKMITSYAALLYQLEEQKKLSLK